MSALQKGNPAYRDVTVMIAEWDKWGRSDVAKKLGVRRRSTLIMFVDGKEVGRVVAQTDTPSIEGLFKAALQA